MELKIEKDENRLIVLLTGRLDTIASEQVAESVTQMIEEEVRLEIDMKDCTYISSAGLRALLKIAKCVNAYHGTVHVQNVQKQVKDVMEMTGFNKLLAGYEV